MTVPLHARATASGKTMQMTFMRRLIVFTKILRKPIPR
jgi:hypothetical protein